jgi:hypothetical protein
MSPARPNRAAFPTLPIVTAVAGALLLSACDSPPSQPGYRVCQNSKGFRVPEDDCQGGGTGYSHAYIGQSRLGMGERVNAIASPADVSRGGFGMSAHGSAGE